MTTIHLITEVISVKESPNELRDAIRFGQLPDISVTEIWSYYREMSGKTHVTETPVIIMKNHIVKIKDNKNEITIYPHDGKAWSGGFADNH